MSILDLLQDVVWTAPDGASFIIKTLECGYDRKHIGDIKENPRTSVSHSTSTKGGGGKKSKTSSSTSVSTSQSKKRVGDSNDTFTDLGIGGRDVQMDCYFIGNKHHIESEIFIKALCQVGKSKLRLAYGDEFTVNVLNFGVKYSLVEKINSTIVSVKWHETSPSTYPKSQTSKKKEIKNLATEAKENIAQTVETTTNAITSPTRLAAFAANFSSALNKVSVALDVANNITLNSIMSDILGQNIMSNSFTITSQLGVLFVKSAMLVNKTKSLASGFTLPGYSSLFGGWQSLLASLKTESLKGAAGSTYTPEQVDELKLNDSIASSAIISVAETLLDTEFETRAEAVEAAKNLVEIENEWTEFVEEQESKITNLEDAYIRDGSTSDIVAAAANEILEKSYKLKVEQTIILTEDKTPIELAYEYYKTDFMENPDDTLEYLIRTNNFSDDEFFLIKRGQEIKIYV